MSKYPAALYGAMFPALFYSVISYNVYADLNASDVLQLSLAQLTDIKVTSVSKSPEKASEAAAAIYVISSEDIRRIGATNVPDALRIVPGLNVAQVGSSQWAITSRGFNGQFANKLLVLIDGRTIYTPLFSGVHWDVQDVPLEDIERIEVIRGPGATLWGANAVNGVINIITKKAQDTQGGYASLTTGTQLHAQGVVRQGYKIGDDAYARVYAKYDDGDSFKTLNGKSAGDSWKKYQSGFRADWNQSAEQSFTLQGDVYSMPERLPWNTPSLSSPPTQYFDTTFNQNGANILGRWNYTNSPESTMTLQVYLDHTQRDTVALINTTTMDIDFQDIYTGFSGNEITWGLGYRLIEEDAARTFYYTLNPSRRIDPLYNAFLQDKITLLPNNLFLTLGSKLEDNAYSGIEVQPSARLTWLVDQKQTLWTAVSRAVKTPNHGTSNGSLAFAVAPSSAFGLSSPPALAVVGTNGNPGLNSEKLIAFEVGYRVQPIKTMSLDVSTFYNHYSNIIRGIMGAPTLGTFQGTDYYYIPIEPFNDNSARSYGVELSANWEVTDNWRLSSGYSYMHLSVSKIDPAFPIAGTTPQQQVNLRSTLLLPYNTEMDNTLYYVDNLSGIHIPSYFRLDTRFAWKATEGMEVSLVGQNLLDSQHPEFPGFIYQNAEQVPRSAYVNVTFHF